MVSAKLAAIWRTLTLTKNPLAGFLLQRSQSRKAVTFRNGSTFSLTWPQFRYIRDSYKLFARYNISQVDDDLFKLENNEGIIIGDAALMLLISNLTQNYSLKQESEDLYKIWNGYIELIGSRNMLVCIQEQLTGEYECDCRGKVVLDVGGFQGESAVYFWQKGAKKIIIYEPLAENVKYIKRNVELNHVDAEIIQAGIGKEDGTVTIHFDRVDPGFGFHSQGSKMVEIQVVDVSKVIEKSGADVGKFDCESAEQYLVDVSPSILRKIPYYIIEVHSPQIRQDVLHKFEGIGYFLKKEFSKHSGFSVLILQKSK